MSKPRYTKDEFWEQVRRFWKPNSTYFSLVRENEYVIVSLDESKKYCVFRYESNKLKAIVFDELYEVYKELYVRGNLPRDFMKQPGNSIRLINKKTWHAPGAAMYALLPRLDSAIKVETGGHLVV